MSVLTPRDRETAQETMERERCEQWTDHVFATSPMVRFMAKHLALLGCDPRTPQPPATQPGRTPEPKLVIAPCGEGIAGGFSPSQPGEPTSYSSILLCSNRIYSRAHLEDTLSHEMVHWFDHCRFLVDWTNLRHHACSEIRAASLSGDCRFMREFTRRQYGFKAQHQTCVKRRAVLSVLANPACNNDRAKAESVVDEVFTSCFGDTRPFDEVSARAHMIAFPHTDKGPFRSISMPGDYSARSERLRRRVARQRLVMWSFLSSCEKVASRRGPGRHARSASRARGLSLSRR